MDAPGHGRERVLVRALLQRQVRCERPYQSPPCSTAASTRATFRFRRPVAHAASGGNRDGSVLNALSRESRAAKFAPVPVLRPEPATKDRRDETTQHFSHVCRERCIIDVNVVFFTTRVFWAGSHRRNGACSDRRRVGRQPRRQGARCLRCNDTSRTDRDDVADHCHRLGL